MADDRKVVARVVLNFERDVRQEVNTFHVTRVDGAELVASDLAHITGVFHSWWTTTYRNLTASTIVLSTIVATKLDPSAPLQDTEAVGTTGAITETPFPGNVTLSVSERTGLAGRKYRGRFYAVSIVPSQRGATDTVLPGVVGSFLACLNNLIFLLANESSGYQLVIYHRSELTYTGVDGAAVDSVLDSQRRRLPSRGR